MEPEKPPGEVKDNRGDQQESDSPIRRFLNAHRPYLYWGMPVVVLAVLADVYEIFSVRDILNDPPVAVDDCFYCHQVTFECDYQNPHSLKQGQMASGLKPFDNDSDEDWFDVLSLDFPQNGVFYNNAGGVAGTYSIDEKEELADSELAFVPARGFSGEARLEYSVIDRAGTRASAHMLLCVAPGNSENTVPEQESFLDDTEETPLPRIHADDSSVLNVVEVVLDSGLQVTGANGWLLAALSRLERFWSAEDPARGVSVMGNQVANLSAIEIVSFLQEETQSISCHWDLGPIKGFAYREDAQELVLREDKNAYSRLCEYFFYNRLNQPIDLLLALNMKGVSL